MTREESSDLCCSFCGKAQREVKKLIAGPVVYICNECIALCNDILTEDPGHDEYMRQNELDKAARDLRSEARRLAMHAVEEALQNITTEAHVQWLEGGSVGPDPAVRFIKFGEKP